MLSFISYEHVMPRTVEGILLGRNEECVTTERGPLGIARLTYCAQSFTSETRIILEQDYNFLGLIFNLKHDLDYSLNGSEVPETLCQGDVGLLYLPKGCIGYHFKTADYAMFMLEVSQPYLEFWSPHSPVVKWFLKNVSGKTPCLARTHLSMSHDLWDLIDSMLTEGMPKLVKEPVISARINAIFALCINEMNNAAQSLTQAALPSGVWKAHECMMKDLAKHWSLELLAHEAGMARVKLNREFRKAYGKTVIEFLFDERMKKAMLLIRDTDMLMKQVAKAVGYKNETNFYEAFRKRFHISPSELRQQQGAVVSVS